MPEPVPLDGPTVSIRLARALSAGEADAATVARQISAALPPKDHNLPRTVGRYRILDRLGRGGMGVVYGAWDDRLQRPVALKMLRAAAADPDDLARFQREVRIAASLKHPGIVAVHEVGSDGADPFFTMDIVDGVPLDAWCAKQALGRDARVDLVSKVAQAVHHAHTRGVLHRDLKPGNILVREDGQPVILDFGLAKPTTETVSTFNTMTGTAMGTPAYMSPEQAGGRVHEVDTRTDVYALGVILYQLVTGRLPFEGRDPMEICRKVVEEEVPRPSTRGLRLPADLETVILKALEKDPSRRYPSALHLEEELRRYLSGEPITARKASAWYRIRRRVARNPVVSSLAAALVLSILGGGAWIVRSVTLQARLLSERETALASAQESAREREVALHQAESAIRDREKALARLEADRTARAILDRAARIRAEGAPSIAVLAAIDEAIAASPDNAEPHIERGRFLLQAGRFEEAIGPLRRAVALAPDHVAARHDLCAALGEAGQFEEAVRMENELRRVAPDGWAARLLDGRDAWRRGDLDASETALRRSVELHETSAALCLLSVILAQTGRVREAVEISDRAYTLEIPGPHEWADRVGVLLRAGLQERAASNADRLAKTLPDLPHGHAALAHAHLSSQRMDDALAAADRALACDASYPPALRARTMALLGLDRLEEARAAADRIPDALDPFGENRVLRAMILLRMGRPEDSLRLLDAAPDAIRALLAPSSARIDALRILGRHEEELRESDLLVHRYPDAPLAHRSRAVALSAAGRHADALTEYDETLRLAPDQARMHAGRAQCLLALGRAEDALAAADAGIAAGLPGPIVRCQRAESLLALGRDAEALDAILPVIAGPSPPHDAHLLCGVAQARLGRPVDARASLETFLRLEPAHPRAPDARAILDRLAGR